MPICNKAPLPGGKKNSAAEIDDHASEAAKVKRTREQAYFNSYDFDAIEVLPYDEDDDSEGGNGDKQSKTAGSNNANSGIATVKSKMNAGKYSNRSTLSTQSLSQRQRQHQHASISSRSNSTVPSSVSDGSNRSSSHSSEHSVHHGGYLQQLGSFLISTQPPSSSAAAAAVPSSARSNVSQHHLDQLPSHNKSNEFGQMSDVDNANFLLPRAMLKYQSVGTINSMPLSIIYSTASVTTSAAAPTAAAAAAAVTTQTGKRLQNGNNNNNNNNNTQMMTTSTNNSNKNNSMTNKMFLPSSSNNKTRLNYGNGDNTGFPTAIEKPSVAQATTITSLPNANITMATTNKILARSKKQSVCSTASTATSTTSASVVIGTDPETPPPLTASSSTLQSVCDDGIGDDDVDDDVGRKTIMAATKIKTKTKPLTPAALSTAPNATASVVEREKRGRTGSHQSHYSTDKSGSSGYYSSNVCSTYSIEDHIYCEPVIDILDLNSNSKSVVGGGGNVNSMITKYTKSLQQQQQKQQQEQPLKEKTTLNSKMEHVICPQTNSRSRDMNGVGQSKRFVGSDCEADDADDADDDDDDDGDDYDYNNANAVKAKHTMSLRAPKDPLVPSLHFNENLRILETSIENLDRHLKNYPSLSSQERIASFVQTHHAYLQNFDLGEKLRVYNHLPTIKEGFDPTTSQPNQWQDDVTDDSLQDIDLDSFLLDHERKHGASTASKLAKKTSATNNGIDNPSFLTDELEENNYKCAKYINSCPEDAYRVESDIVAGVTTATAHSERSISVDRFVKRYEDQIHFENTRELLEDVREKIRLLSRSHNEQPTYNDESHAITDDAIQHATTTTAELLPKELESIIKTLKIELEAYLSRMNQHSELEIKQLYSGLVKNHNIVKMKKAFERRRSTHSLSAHDSEYDYDAYEAIRDGVLISNFGVPLSIRQKITSIRCASDPNFKMKRKSLNEVFPTAECYIETCDNKHSASSLADGSNRIYMQAPRTQMQRNLSFHKPILNKLDANVQTNHVHEAGSAIRVAGSSVAGGGGGIGGTAGGGSGAESSGSGDKDAILDWHRKKPSIWEMYYGTNRMNQSLLDKRNDMILNTNHPTMSYPSSRPESDFTLDLPRAEQLRIKMEKEKKFRQRCRYITTFLSLIFFLLTVVVVSLVSTRGKRMFGSMI